MENYKSNSVILGMLILINLAIFIVGVLLVKMDLERQSATAQSYYKNAIIAPDGQTSSKFIQFVQTFYANEPYKSYTDFLSLYVSGSSKKYFNDFYAYYFSAMQGISDKMVLLPPENLFIGYLQLHSESDYKKLNEYQRVLVDAAIPYKTFAVWYTKRTEQGYSKHYPLYNTEDETVLTYARNFIESFAERGFPFEYLSRIMALELELLYRSARTVSFWDANQRWDNRVLQKIYKRIQEYKERFTDYFAAYQTGAVNWIMSMERLVDHEISDRGFFVNQEQKEALERESKLVGAIPGLRVEQLKIDSRTGETP